jgi:hypothetical protein
VDLLYIVSLTPGNEAGMFLIVIPNKLSLRRNHRALGSLPYRTAPRSAMKFV